MKKLLLSAAILAITATATATPVLVGSTTDPLGVLGLRIRNTTYDVFFSTESYDTLFPTAGLTPQGGMLPTPTPAGMLSPADGAIASMELVTAFDSRSVTGLLGDACGMSTDGKYNGFCDIFIPTGFSCAGAVCSNSVVDEAPFSLRAPDTGDSRRSRNLSPTPLLRLAHTAGLPQLNASRRSTPTSKR